MANTIDWGKATQNNTNGFGKYQNTIGAASIYADSYAGETALVGTSAAFSYSKSSYHQDEADPTPTITGTTGGTFNGSAGLVFVDTGTHNSTTGQIDLSASTIDSHIITYTVDGVQSGQTVGVTASPFISNTYSMQFDAASSNYLQVSNSTAFDFGTSDFTWSFWLNYTTHTNYAGLLFTGHTNSEYRLKFQTSGQILFLQNADGDSQVADLGTNIVGTGWHHLCLVRSSGTITTHLDGVIVDTNSRTGNINSNGNDLLIGKNGISYFDGKLDEIAFWNAALSSDAVQEIYNATANNTGKALDLSTDYNNYTSSSNLQYWNRLGD